LTNPFKHLAKKVVVDLRLKKFARHERSLNFAEEFKKVKKVLIIVPSGNEYTESVQDFIKGAGLVFKNASVSTFASSTLRKSDLTWFGIPNEKYLHLIRDESFDLVLDINLRPDRVCAYLSALSGAAMRLNLIGGDYDYIYNLHFRSDNANNINERLNNIIVCLNKFNPQKIMQ
jgi:hypothetical protein